MAIALFLILHWYSSLFFQSFFHHRYAAHGQFSMSRGWERFFFICCYISQGSSYISAAAYGMMHRLHHAHTDTEHDPHSPLYSNNPFLLIWKTRNSYHAIFSGRTEVDQKYQKNLPQWKAFDLLAHNWISRVLWGAIYTGIYFYLATDWWMYLFLPVTFAMGALQGLAVNWWAHKFGYVNFQHGNDSKNILPVDLLFWGEAYHNNHHQHPARANNAVKWFEFDTGWQVIRLLNWLQVIRLKPVAVTVHP